MASKPEPDAFAGSPLPFLGDRGEKLSGKVEAFQQSADVSLLHVWIFEQGNQGFHVRFVDQQV